MVLATGLNTSFLDRPYKNQATVDTYMLGLQLAKQLDSHEDAARVIVTEVVDSIFGFLPSQDMRGRW